MSHRAIVILSGFVLTACGASTPRPEPANQERDPVVSSDEGAVDSATEGSEGAGAAGGKKCYEKCATLIKQAGTLFGRAEGLKDGPARKRAHESAGDAYVDAWRGCSLGIPNGLDLGCEGAGEVVPRMVRAFERSARDERVIFGYLVALDPNWRPEGSEIVALTSLREASDRASAGAQKQPKNAGAKKALAAAAFGYIASGEEASASKTVAAFRRHYARTDPGDASLLGVALASYHNDKGAHHKALKALGGKIPGKVEPRVEILWHSERGRALAGLRREKPASASFQQALDRWRPPSNDNMKKFLGRSQPAPMLGRERVVDAIGAAHFFFAEKKRKEAATLRMPPYKGPPTVAGISKHMNTKVGEWIRQKQARLTEADRAYKKITAIRPVAPPRWVVAAGAGVGQMWSDFADEFTNAPVPRHIAEDSELKAGYEKTLQNAMAPLVQTARRAFTVCRDTARQHRIDSEDARRCSTWLDEHPKP